MEAHIHTVDASVHFLPTGEDRIENQLFFQKNFRRDLDLRSFCLRNEVKIEKIMEGATKLSLEGHNHREDAFIHFQTTAEDRIEKSIFFEIFKQKTKKIDFFGFHAFFLLPRFDRAGKG